MTTRRSANQQGVPCTCFADIYGNQRSLGCKAHDPLLVARRAEGLAQARALTAEHERDEALGRVAELGRHLSEVCDERDIARCRAEAAELRLRAYPAEEELRSERDEARAEARSWQSRWSLENDERCHAESGLDEARAEVERLRTALEWYARGPSGNGHCGDYGELARKVLDNA